MFAGGFAGLRRVRLDSGGRLVIPKAFRDQLQADTLMVGLGPRRGMLVMMDREVLRDAQDEFARRNPPGVPLNRSADSVDRYLSLCQQVSVSDRGRITLPDVFIAWALNGADEAMVLGLQDMIVVMSMVAFDTMMAETQETLAAELAAVYPRASADERCPGQPGIEKRKEP